MKRIGCILLFFVWLAGIGQAQNNPGHEPVFKIHGPTIIAFYPHVSQKDLDSGEGDAEAIDDFGFYASQVEKRLEKAGVGFFVEETRSFKVRVQGKVNAFRVGKISIGYYFITPGKEPHVEYGVMTDEDLVGVAREYFGKRIP
ncbi:MAG: hypothetical protein ABSB60_11040 [Terracidiphilus sp.]|jgi:hypothetical protein